MLNYIFKLFDYLKLLNDNGIENVLDTFSLFEPYGWSFRIYKH